jgi:LysM repeat protein
VQITHIVKPGEKLSTIAKKYGVTLSDLKTWNYIGKKGVKAGKRLAVYVRKQDSAPVDKPETKAEDKNLAKNTGTVTEDKKLAENTSTTSKTLEHQVKAGETIYSISKKYGVSVAKLRQLNQLSKNAGIQKGTVLKIRESQ